MMSLLDQLEKLIELHEGGILDEEDFNKAKSIILGQSQSEIVLSGTQGSKQTTENINEYSSKERGSTKSVLETDGCLVVLFITCGLGTFLGLTLLILHSLYLNTQDNKPVPNLSRAKFVTTKTYNDWS